MNQAQRTVRVLLIGPGHADTASSREWLGPAAEIIRVATLREARDLLSKSHFDYVLMPSNAVTENLPEETSSIGADLLENVSQGVGLVNDQGSLVWSNASLAGFPQEVRDWVSKTSAESMTRFRGRSHAERAAGHRATLTTANGGTFELSTTPIVDVNQQAMQAVAVIWDLTEAKRRQKELAAADHAGRELIRLDAEQMSRLDTQERLGLLEQKIIRCLRDVMHFNHFSIRVLEKKTNKLEPLISYGFAEDAQQSDLFALPDGNGVCGYVAYHGRSHICADTTQDPLYFPGIKGAWSSLTVPLKLNDETIGVLNVESRKKGSFSDERRQLAEFIGRDIAMALHILDLLVTERYATTGRLGSDVMAEISGPVNDILTDAENLIEDYIGHDDLRFRLNRITSTAVGIRDAIKRVTSQRRGLIGSSTTGIRRTDPILTGKRILIADDEVMIRDTVRDVLASYGCQVQVADDGAKAIEIIQQNPFDLVLSDIRMPHRDGYHVFAAAKDANKDLPVILMTGFGYDPNHAIVRARREGLAAVLFKPFKVDQLLGEIRTALRNAAAKQS